MLQFELVFAQVVCNCPAGRSGLLCQELTNSQQARLADFQADQGGGRVQGGAADGVGSGVRSLIRLDGTKLFSLKTIKNKR